MPQVTVAAVIRSEYKRKDNTYYVRIRLYYKKLKVISTNIVARADQLTKRLTVKDPVLKDQIDTLVRDMQGAANSIPFFDLKDMTVDDVANRIEFILSAPNFSLDFPSYGRKIANEYDPNSRSNFMVSINSLCKFLGTYSFDISQITSSLMFKYEKYLSTKYGENSRTTSLYTRSIATIHRRAQKEYNNYERDEIRIKNPFAYYQCPQQNQSEHRDLDPSIIQKMISMRKSLTGQERMGVDVFLFYFAMMGMNAPDIYSCRKPVNGIVEYNRTKTRKRRKDKALMLVRIEPCIHEIIKDYLDPEDSEYFLSFHSKYKDYKQFARATNRGLDKFKERINLDKKITLYCARHTWPTIAYSAGVPESTIDICLCHINPSLKLNSVYINRDWEIVWQANAKVLATLNWD